MTHVTLGFIVQLEYPARPNLESSGVRYLGEGLRSTWQCRDQRHRIRLHRVLYSGLLICSAVVLVALNVMF